MSKQIPCVNPLAKDPEYINWEEVQKLINIGDHLKFTANLSTHKITRKLYDQKGYDMFEIKIWGEEEQ